MATETYFLPGYGVVVDEEDGDEVFIPGYGVVANNEVAPPAAPGRIMSSLAGPGGLAGSGGIAGAGGGLAG